MANQPPNPEQTRWLLKEAEALSTKLMKTPGCTSSDFTSCIEREVAADDANGKRRSDGRRRGWNGYRQEKMCSACAAFWAASVVVNHLNDRLRRDLEVQEEQRRAAIKALPDAPPEVYAAMDAALKTER